MLRWAKEEYQVFHHRRAITKIEKHYAVLRKEYRREGRMMDLNKLVSDEQFEVELYSDMIDQIATHRWVRKLQRYDIPFPHPNIDDGTVWAPSNQLDVHFLTTEGRHLARTAIREERAARWRDWLIIGPLAGLFGAVFGHVVTLYPDQIVAFLKALGE